MAVIVLNVLQVVNLLTALKASREADLSNDARHAREMPTDGGRDAHSSAADATVWLIGDRRDSIPATLSRQLKCNACVERPACVRQLRSLLGESVPGERAHENRCHSYSRNGCHGLPDSMALEEVFDACLFRNSSIREASGNLRQHASERASSLLPPRSSRLFDPPPPTRSLWRAGPEIGNCLGTTGHYRASVWLQTL